MGVWASLVGGVAPGRMMRYPLIHHATIYYPVVREL